MPTSDALSRLDRLERLKGILKSRDHATVAELARDLGVSPRTLARDIDLLRRSGVPIDADRGRGGGLRGGPRWDYGRLTLNKDEALDLLVGIALAESMDSPLLLSNLAAVKAKLAIAFSPRHVPAIRQIRHRILVGAPASATVRGSLAPAPRAALAAIKRGFFEMRQLRISYADRHGAATVREIEPQFLYLNAPAWYVLAWDCLRGAVRLFRVDRITRVEVLDRGFRLRDRALFLADAERQVRTL